MEDSYKDRVRNVADKLGGYARTLYSNARQQTQSLIGQVWQKYQDSRGSRPYGSSDIPANGGYEPSNDYRNLVRKSEIVPATG